MNRSYFLRNLFSFLVISFILFLIILIIFKIFGGKTTPQPNPSPAPPAPVVKTLPDYADSYAEVSYTVDGHINGDDQHRAIKITVDQFQRKLDILGGYSYNIIQENTIPNNQAAYEVFLTSLKNEGFTLKRKNNTSPASEKGQCPLGFRRIYELNDSGDSLSRLWGSSCGTAIGTFGGNSSAVEELFQAQITDYDKIIDNSNVEL
jgi:hypothetical protein